MNRVKRAPLEYAILRSGGRYKDFKAQLLSWLDSCELRSLRAVCTVLHDLVDSKPGRPFRELFASGATKDLKQDHAWHRIAKFCYTLTITIRPPKTSSEELIEHSSSEESSRLRRKYSRLSDVPLFQKGKNVLARPPWSRTSSKESMTKNKAARLSIAFDKRSDSEQDLQADTIDRWLSLLAPCHQLRTIILGVHGDPAWPGRTEIEDTLVVLRSAVEQSELPKLTEVCFAPIHVMGIIHLRWAGLGVFGFASVPTALPSQQSIWQRLQTLDLQITSPFSNTGDSYVSIAQKQMFEKILHDFLRSFTATLRVLRFVWLGGEGPSPFLLHLGDEDTQQQGDEAEATCAGPDHTTTMSALRWSKLQELYLGTIAQPERTIMMAFPSAPQLRKFWMLRSGRHTATVDYTDRATWVDVMPISRIKSVAAGSQGVKVASMIAVMRRRSDASSVYSQDDE